MLLILKVDHWIEVTHLTYISLIKDTDNLIPGHRMQPSVTSRTTYFAGTFIPSKPIKRLDMSIDINMGN